jgi:glycine cleavage system H protein
MTDIPKDLKYTASHEWIKNEGNGVVQVGITQHAQSLLGDIVFVDIAQLNHALPAGHSAGVVESVKAASDIYIPVTGKIIEFNEQLNAQPDLINQDPYGAGWIFRVQIDSAADLENLLSADQYQSSIA